MWVSEDREEEEGLPRPSGFIYVPGGRRSAGFLLSAVRDGTNKLENKHRLPKPTTRQPLYCPRNDSLLQVPARPRTRSKSGALGDVG